MVYYDIGYSAHVTFKWLGIQVFEIYLQLQTYSKTK